MKAGGEWDTRRIVSRERRAYRPMTGAYLQALRSLRGPPGAHMHTFWLHGLIVQSLFVLRVMRTSGDHGHLHAGAGPLKDRPALFLIT